MGDERIGFRAVCAALLAGVTAGGFARSAHAEVLSGHFSERIGTFIFDLNSGTPIAYEFGDGANHVTMWPGFASYFPWEGSLWFYGHGEDDTFIDTDVAFVPGITDVSLITDASAFMFHDWNLPEPIAASDFVPTEPAPDGWVTPPVGTLLMRNINTGHYGAVVLHDMHDWINHVPLDLQYGPYSVVAEMTWYFQTDGSGDFSSVPAPGAAGLLVVAGSVFARRRRA